MSIESFVLGNDEKAIFTLRSLYRKYGYLPYKMNKFEEYDLYVRNKDFLVSDNIITFTDLSGKLMALKPDVTLSIIKNGKDIPGCVQKVYYNENVYRVSQSSHAFREIMQVGLECLGDIDDYCITEVLMLAAQSLDSITDDWVLDLSHLGIVSGVLDASGLSDEGRKTVLKCIGEKNAHGIRSVCAEEGIPADKEASLLALVTVYGIPHDVLPNLRECLGRLCGDQLLQLEGVAAALEKMDLGGRLCIDFSVLGDMNYYNGIVFKGFVNGIPSGILSGGQYDKLMQKMGRRAGAIGFAVYLDLLERLNSETEEFDVDTILLYDETADPNVLRDAVTMLTENGRSVMAQKAVPEKLRFKQLLRLNERGVEILENHA